MIKSDFRQRCLKSDSRKFRFVSFMDERKRGAVRVRVQFRAGPRVIFFVAVVVLCYGSNVTMNLKSYDMNGLPLESPLFVTSEQAEKKKCGE